MPSSLTWIDPDRPLPDPQQQSTTESSNGLIAAGLDLSTTRLFEAYSKGIFPWFSEGEPVLWWSPDPRMCLNPAAFKLHRSLRKRIQNGLRQGSLEIRVDADFDQVIHHCAAQQRPGQNGTWIVPPMIDAYRAFYRDGYVHAVTAHWDGELIGGLYAVNIGHAVFGESMFTLKPDGSKIALAALVALALRESVPLIDCQQETAHLGTLGAAPIPQAIFLETVRSAAQAPPMSWGFNASTWLTLDPRLSAHNMSS
jgi:leucyl/phenylalanyl-tRNA---protein transferase